MWGSTVPGADADSAPDPGPQGGAPAPDGGTAAGAGALTELRAGPVRAAAIPAAEPVVEEWLRRWGTLRAAAEAVPGARPLLGRGIAWDVPGGPAGERWVVRHYRRGGAAAPLLEDRYLRRGTPRPEREARVSAEVRARGIDTPPIVAWALYPAGRLWYRADLITEKVPDARDLAAILFGRAGYDDDAPDGPRQTGRRHALEAAGRLLRELAEAGVLHRDLNAKNILIQSGAGGAPPRPWVLDLDACALREGPDPAARRVMRARLLRSLAKWGRRTRLPLTAPELALLEEATTGVG